MLNIAHYLTLMRIVISPIFLLTYIQHDSLGISSTLLPFVLIFLLGISELSDALDGYFARKYNQVTDLGKILDPMADSIARISVFLTFTLPPIQLPMPLVFIFIYRDSIISTLRTVCALKGIALGARISGKLKAVVQATTAFTILALMIPQSLGYLSLETLRFTSLIIVGIAAVYTVLSGVDYFIAHRHHLASMLIQKKIEN